MRAFFPRSVRTGCACLALFTLSMLGAGCSGCSDDPPSRTCVNTTDCRTGEVCIGGECVSTSDNGMSTPDLGDGGGVDIGGGGDAGQACSTDGQCTDGVCTGGACCPTDNACGQQCCGSAETCFANACVTPGATCRDAQDCGANQYCEPGLGDGPPPPGPDMGVMCIGSVPAMGRCVDLPPTCTGNEPPGTICVDECQFVPPVEQLDAVEQWRWGPGTATSNTAYLDVWSTPAVGRLSDTNCDGVVDEFDPPNIIFVSGNAETSYCSNPSLFSNPTPCKTGVLRILDGPTGQEIRSIRRPSQTSVGWSGVSVAIGDLDHDGDMELVAVSGEGHLVIVDHEGNIVDIADEPLFAGWINDGSFGWGGALSIADMNRDGNPEIAYGNVLYTTDGTDLTRLYAGTGQFGGHQDHSAISVMVNLDDDPDLELLAGASIYEYGSGTPTYATTVPQGFSAVADFNGDGDADIVVVANGRVYLLNASNGTNMVNDVGATAGSPGNGGPPTIADFDGDGLPEIGVAWRNEYEVFEINAAGTALESKWGTPNHDLSSSVTGSTVFDFEGDGKAEVIYNDECFLWVYDGTTGAVRFATPTTSFTATEASLVADVDSDGSAEIVVISNGSDPSPGGSWPCDTSPWNQAPGVNDPDFGRPPWVGSDGVSQAYRGISVFRARDNSWVGTRSLWNQHAYSVSNVCGDRGDPCGAGSTYGDIPRNQVENWSVSFLNNFRQNIQGEGIFDAPDATVSLQVGCSPAQLVGNVRNLGQAVLAAGVEVVFYSVSGGVETEVGRGTTSTSLFPGQVAPVSVPLTGNPDGVTYRARIVVDPANPVFQECRSDNNESTDVTGRCLG